MMSNQEIEAQIQREHQEYMNKPFSDTLPDWFLSKFSAAIMEVPIGTVENRAETFTSILSKKVPAELTIFEVGVMINVYLATPPKVLAKDPKQFIQLKKTFEGIFVQWATVYRKEEERKQRKAANMSAENRSKIIHANGIGANQLRAK